MRRRGFLTAIGVTSIGGLAGCVGGPVVEETTEREDDADDSAGEGDGDDSAGEGGDDDSTGEWSSEPYADYDTTDVEVRSAEGDALGVVRAAIADTGEKRYTGLSDAESLPADAGMLFVFGEPRESLTFVMRRMDFGIDIVYADAEGTITEIHNAPAPAPDEDGNEQEYDGSGQYVLEVPYEWTDRHGVEVGDSLAFEL